MTSRVTPFIREELTAIHHWREGDHRAQAVVLARALESRGVPIQLLEFQDSTCIYCGIDSMPMEGQDMWVVEVRKVRPMISLLARLMGSRYVSDDVLLRPTYHMYYRFGSNVYGPAKLRYEGMVSSTTLVLLFVIGE